jgi:hypothetical protein
MITFRKFTESDWFEIDDPVSVYSDKVNDIIKEFFGLLKNGVNFTMVENGKVICCGGVVYVDENNAESWIRLSTRAAQKPLAILKTVKVGFDMITRSLGAINVSSHVLEGFEAGERLAEYLGFKKTEDFMLINDKKYNKYAKI